MAGLLAPRSSCLHRHRQQAHSAAAVAQHVGCIARGAAATRAWPAALPSRSTGSTKHGRCTSCAAVSTNPAYTFGKIDEAVRQRDPAGIMTVDGTVQKSSVLLGVAILGAAYTWMQVYSGNAAAAMAAINAGRAAGIIALVSALATMFKPQWSPTTSLIFAASKGVALGAFSSIMELRAPGIVLNATMLVLGTAASLLAAYNARLITVTDRFRDGVMMVTGGYMFVILGSWLMSLVGLQLPSLFSGGIMGIGLSLVAAALAASNLLLDFDMIRNMARSRVPKWMEWYAGWSLLITLVWMWTEAVRLLALMAGSRDN